VQEVFLDTYHFLLPKFVHFHQTKKIKFFFYKTMFLNKFKLFTKYLKLTDPEAIRFDCGLKLQQKT